MEHAPAPPLLDLIIQCKIVAVQGTRLLRFGIGARLVVNNCFPGNHRPLVVVARVHTGYALHLGASGRPKKWMKGGRCSPRCRLLITKELEELFVPALRL